MLEFVCSQTISLRFFCRCKPPVVCLDDADVDENLEIMVNPAVSNIALPPPRGYYVDVNVNGLAHGKTETTGGQNENHVYLRTSAIRRHGLCWNAVQAR